MRRNGTILQRRQNKNNVLIDRQKTINMWTNYLTDVYKAEKPPDFPPDHEIHKVDLQKYFETAE